MIKKKKNYTPACVVRVFQNHNHGVLGAVPDWLELRLFDIHGHQHKIRKRVV